MNAHLSRTLSHRRPLLVALGLLLTQSTPAAVTLVKDINTDFNEFSSSPTDLFHINGVTYFYAQDDVRGYELWKSDGTEAGTVLVKDIRPGSGDSNPRNFVNLNGTLYFTANDGVNGQALWKSDGTEVGTVLVTNNISIPFGMVVANGMLFFAGGTGNGYDLWKSDGTAAGTVLVRVLPDPDYPRDPAITQLTAVGDKVFFKGATCGGSCGNYALWISDGTTAGTTLLKGEPPDNLVAVNGTLFFAGSATGLGNELWKSDGTTNGTVLVKDIRPGSGHSNPANLVNVNGTLFFTANDGTNGVELWMSDGTTNGTVMVKDIIAGSGGAGFANFANINGTLFFSGSEGTNGFELWRSDGTSNGTFIVKNIAAGSADSDPANLTDVNGTLFFGATGTGGLELWMSDGTSNGTVRVKDIAAGSGNSGPNYLVNASGTLLFRATDGVHGLELWRSDGTDAGTFMVKDVRSGTLGSSPGHFADVNGTLFFSAATTNYGNELWKSDGTSSGTILVSDIQSGTGNSSPVNLANVDGTLFFAAATTANGSELWKSDGTSNGTVMVKDIYAGTTSSSPGNLLNVNGTLFFSANSSGFGNELWKSDGTTNGTALVKDIRAGGTSSTISNLVNIGGTVYFSANDGTNGIELWKSDGTDPGTVMVANLAPTNSSSNPDNLVNVNGTLFFTANNATNGIELWKSDGSEPGTTQVKDILPGTTSPSPANLVNVDGTLFFTANGGGGLELWKSDGSSNGTVMVKDIRAGSGGSSPYNLTAVGNTLFFVADDNTNGFELWKSDGTTNGTVMVKDIRAGPLDSNPANLVNLGGTLFFTADDGLAGIELWQSDGTEAGTFKVADTSGDTGDGDPVNLTPVAAVNRTLFFAATTQATGQELFVYTADDFGDAPASYPTKLVNNGARHAIAPGGPLLFLGAVSPDGETDAHPDAVAMGDNSADTNDEDGVMLPAFLNSGQTQAVSVVVTGSNGVLQAWVDWNADGDWNDAGEQVFTNQLVSAGTNDLILPVPVLSVGGPSFARFRLSTTGDLAPTGAAPDGEVEDYQVTLNLPPTLSGVAATNVGQSGAWQTNYAFSLTFADDNGLVVASFSPGNVTVTGPGGALAVTAAVEPSGSNGSPRTVAYPVTPPGGSWNDADNGTYTIALSVNEVADVGGLFVAGNTNIGTITVNMDTTPPTTTLLGHPADPTNSTSATFSFSASDGAGTGVAGFESSVDGGAFGSASSPQTISPLNEGNHSFQVRAFDAVGNVETNPVSFAWTVDLTPPTVNIGAPSAEVATISEAVQFTITYGGADFVTLADGDVGVNTTGTATATATVSGTGLVTRTVTLNNLGGAGTLGFGLAAATARDLAGNLAPAAGPSGTFQMIQPPPTTLQIEPLDAGSFRLSFNGLSNRTYRVLYAGSPDLGLALWQSLGSALVNSQGLATLTNSAAESARYYRAVFP